jgi:hypothetical protein
VGEGSASRPGFSLPPGKEPVPIIQEAGWATGPVWTGAEILPHRDLIPGPSSPLPEPIPTELPRLTCNGYIQFKYLFSKSDTALSNWKSSRQNLSVPPGSQHNKLCCLFSRLYNVSPQLQHPLLPLDNIPQFVSRWERNNCQLPTCRYNK